MNETLERPALIERAAARMRMTEGQLYTAVLVFFLALLLGLTALPQAHRRVDVGDGLTGNLPAEVAP
jgi:hypothetical protein